MSLDVYLTMPGQKRKYEARIFVREDGQTKEMSREEWDAKFPGREPAVMEETETEEVFSANITHNLTRMADEAGIYLAVWRPGEFLDPDLHRKITEQVEAGNYHSPGGVLELEQSLPTVHASDLIQPLIRGILLMKSDPARFKKFDAENKWGTYDQFVPWLEEYLAACERYPHAEVSVSR